MTRGQLAFQPNTAALRRCIYARRQALDWKVTVAAERCGLSPDQYRRLEGRDLPDVGVGELMVLANGLRLDPVDLLRLVGYPVTPVR